MVTNGKSIIYKEYVKWSFFFILNIWLGTKAAAITAGMVAMTALDTNEPRHVKFHANRPFVYIITERQTGAIFFIGQYLGE